MTRTLTDPGGDSGGVPLFEALIFDTLQDFKNALEKWSVDAKFRYRVKISDKYAHTAVVD
jgi:hypothetical protein